MGDDEVRGLSAAELATETLFPGDTIEYYSMMFVAGDKRGYRLSKVLGIDMSDEDYPVRVDTEEPLPMIIMLKRKRDRLGRAIPDSDAKWRKLRTFRLVNGQVEGETRADRLNAGMKRTVSDAFASVRKQLKADNAQAKSRLIMQSFFKPKPNSPPEESSDDDFDGTRPAQNKKRKTSKYFSNSRSPMTRVPLGNAADSDLNKRYPSKQPQSPERECTVKQKTRKVIEKQRVIRTPSPRRPAPGKRIVERDCESRKIRKHKRLDFVNGTSPSNRPRRWSLVDDDDLDSDDGEARTVELTPSNRSSDKRRKKKTKNKMLVNYIDQIEEKKSSAASLDAYLELDEKQQRVADALKKRMSANFPRRDQPSKALQLNSNAARGNSWSNAREQYREDKSGSKASTQVMDWLIRKSGEELASPTRKQQNRLVVRSPKTEKKPHPADTALALMRKEVFRGGDENDTSESRGKESGFAPVERRNALNDMAREVFDDEPIPRVKMAGLRRQVTRAKESGSKETPKRSQKQKKGSKTPQPRPKLMDTWVVRESELHVNE